MALATAGLLLAGACSGVDGTQAADPEERADPDDSTAELPTSGAVSTGVNTTDLIRLPITLDLERDWNVAASSPLVLVLSDPESSLPEAEVILEMRVDSLAIY